MNRAEFEAWKAENSIASSDEHYNGIDYRFLTTQDGWIVVFEHNADISEYKPLIEAADIEHARSYCARRERIPVPAKSCKKYWSDNNGQ